MLGSEIGGADNPSFRASFSVQNNIWQFTKRTYIPLSFKPGRFLWGWRLVSCLLAIIICLRITEEKGWVLVVRINRRLLCLSTLWAWDIAHLGQGQPYLHKSQIEWHRAIPPTLSRARNSRSFSDIDQKVSNQGWVNVEIETFFLRLVTLYLCCFCFNPNALLFFWQ